MTPEEMTETLKKGFQMVVEHAQALGQSKDKWSAEELMMMSDLVKDMSEVHKNIAKAHHCYAEHSVEKY